MAANLTSPGRKRGVLRRRALDHARLEGAGEQSESFAHAPTCGDKHDVHESTQRFPPFVLQHVPPGTNGLSSTSQLPAGFVVQPEVEPAAPVHPATSLICALVKRSVEPSGHVTVSLPSPFGRKRHASRP